MAGVTRPFAPLIPVEAQLGLGLLHGSLRTLWCSWQRIGCPEGKHSQPRSHYNIAPPKRFNSTTRHTCSPYHVSNLLP